MRASSNSSFLIEQFYPVVGTLASLAIVFAVFCYHKWKTTPAGDWPVIEGRVQSARVIHGSGRDPGKHAVISYSYFVNEYQSGEFTKSFLRENAAEEFAAGLKDAKVQIHYNPRDPAVSNLKDDELEQLLVATGKKSVG